MKSSSGEYFIALDHVRAVAALVVFTWHFIYGIKWQQVPPPEFHSFPLSLLTQGHTGVAIFMTLSGYLFARLLGEKDIIYRSFIWNRFLRIAPLLFAVILFCAFNEYREGRSLIDYAKNIMVGVIKPTLPNGGWSITTEFHFYIMLPALLFLTTKWKYSLFVVLVLAIVIRTFLYYKIGEIQTLSYWTIIGRLDQFLLGILAYQFRSNIAGKHLIVLCSSIMFLGFYWLFDSQGGFYMNPSYPSPSGIWIYMPTIEGLIYALLIAWYDNSFHHRRGRISQFIALIGTFSYSIYLFHFFVVFKMAVAINTHIVCLSNIYIAILFSFLSFLVMIPVGYISYTCIESPFLKFRKPYIASGQLIKVRQIAVHEIV